MHKEHRSTLGERLEEYAASGALPMHMPGHKRNLSAAPFLAPLGGGLDITEIDGFDDLHGASGILREEMDRAAALWGARRSFFLVNGSTCGLLAAIYAVAAGGGRAVVARNCHKAVFHGLELCGVTSQWLYPDWCGPLGIWGSVPPEAVDRALEETPDARFVLLTSPTYEGVRSDVAAIARMCHRRGVPLIVDEAHGAHLGLGGFPDGGVKLGADIVVQSAHKTLLSLTQTALIHISGNLVDEAAVERALNVFETSSPSYLLLASLSGCVRRLERPDCFAPWRAGLRAFDRGIAGLTRLAVPNHGALAGENDPSVFAWDESKIMIVPVGHACGSGADREIGPEDGRSGRGGYALMDALRRDCHIELEMALPHYALAMTGAGDGEEGLTRLARALTDLDGTWEGKILIPGPPPQAAPARMSPREALCAPFETLPLDGAAGRVCAQYLWVYPPGTPLAVPGEELTPELLAQVDGLLQGGAALRTAPRGVRGAVRVVCE